MKGLGREARTLVESARRADSAPSAVRERARRNFARAVAAGTLGASTTLAKAASLGAFAAPVGASVAAGNSLAVTLVSAVITGVSLGAIAIAPASRMAPAPSSDSGVEARAPASTNTVNVARPREDTGPVSTPADLVSSAEPSAPRAVVLKQSTNDSTSGTSEPAPVENARPSSSVAAFETVANSKASIAQETVLLAQVQRELQQGSPASALTLLNRYQVQFPRGALQEEAMASRIVALCQFGRSADATRWRAEFFRRYPNSPLSSRVRNACAAEMGTSEPGVK